MIAEGTKMPEPIRAFAEHAKAEGHDTAYTYDTERSRWVFLSPMTADLWRYWHEATRQAMERAAEVSDQQIEDALFAAGVVQHTKAIIGAFRTVLAGMEGNA